MSDCKGCSSATSVLPPASANGFAPKPRHTIALVGPPNCGKTTLYNRLTGLRQKVANFPGVTVEQHVGKVQVDGEVYVIDLPGIYGLEPRTEDERVSRDVLKGQMPGVDTPEAVLLVLDSTNLQRHLVVAAGVLALGLPTLVILNFADDLQARGGNVDIAALAQQLGAPVVLVSAARGDGLDKVFTFVRDTSGDPGCAKVPRLGNPRGTAVFVSGSRTVGVDPAAGRNLPASPLGSAHLRRGGGGGVSDYLYRRQTPDESSAGRNHGLRLLG
jgi:ferrous iron transport protein B